MRHSKDIREFRQLDANTQMISKMPTKLVIFLSIFPEKDEQATDRNLKQNYSFNTRKWIKVLRIETIKAHKMFFTESSEITINTILTSINMHKTTEIR